MSLGSYSFTMADKRQWKDLVEEYPLLWHPKHPHFGDEDLKMIYRERLLERCNKECEPIDMETLKQRLAGFQLMCSWSDIQVTPLKTYLRKHKPTPKEVREQIYDLLFADMAKGDKMLELAAEYPCLWKPGHADYEIEHETIIALYELRKQFNEQSETPIGKEELKAKMDGFKKRLYWRSREVTIDELEDNRLEAFAQEIPCIWNPKGPRDLKKYNESCLQLLNMFNTGVNHHLTMDELIIKIDNLKLRHAQKRLNRTVQDSKKYEDSYVTLLDQYNTGVEHQLTMNELRDKVDKLKSRLVQKHLHLTQGQKAPQEIRVLSQNQTETHTTASSSTSERPQKIRVLLQNQTETHTTASSSSGKSQDSIPSQNQIEGQTASDSSSDIRDESIRMLTENQSKPREILDPSGNRDQHKKGINAFMDLAAEFPCLWNPKDINYMDKDVKERCWNQLLEKYNKHSSFMITMAGLKERIGRMSNLLKRNRHYVARGRSVELVNFRQDPLVELVKEYPSLWDHQVISYGVKGIQQLCYEQLLDRYNNESSITITMEHLIKRVNGIILNYVRRGRFCEKKKQHNGEIGEGRSQADTEAGLTPGAPQSASQDDSSDDDEPLTSLRKMATEVGSKQQPSSAVAAASDVVTHVDACLQPAAMADGKVQASATQQAADVIPGIEIHFNLCCFCGETNDDCHNLTIEKPYISTNKTLLILNDLSVVLDFSKDTTPKSICRNCDTRLYDIVEFIKSVKKAQEKFSHVSTVDDFRENVKYDSPTILSDYSESNEGFKNVMDFLSYTDTEFVKETNAFKRKTDENNSKPKKKCRVSIDLNSCTLRTFCDDSNGSYNMESNVGADSVAVTNEESSNNTSANNTQDTINEDSPENASSNAVLAIKEEAIEPNNDASNEVIPETPSELQEEVSFEEQGPHIIIGAGVDVSKGVNLNLINDVETFIVKEDNDSSDTEIASENAVSSKSNGVKLESVLKDANSLEVIRSKTTTKDVPNYKTTNAIEDAKILLLKSANEYNEVFIKEESKEMIDSTAQIESQLDCTEPKQSEEERDSEVIADNIVSQLAGSIDSLVSDKEVTQEAVPSNLKKEPSSNGEPVCVMPKSDLILLVESIVSRMLNK